MLAFMWTVLGLGTLETVAWGNLSTKHAGNLDLVNINQTKDYVQPHPAGGGGKEGWRLPSTVPKGGDTNGGRVEGAENM